MRSPIIVQLASIIPGLGLWLVGKRREAVIAALLVGACAIFFLYSPWPTVSQICFFAGIFIWAIAAGVAYYEANILKKIYSENYERARDVSVVPAPPPSLNRADKNAYKWREMLSRQLKPGEQLETFISGRQVSYFGSWASTSFYRIGLLHDKIMLVIMTIFNKPAIVRHLPFEEIESIKYRRGLATDSLTITVKNEKLLRLQIPRVEREQASLIVSRIKAFKGERL